MRINEAIEHFAFDVDEFFLQPKSMTLDRYEPTWLYVFVCENFCKIGIARNIDRRVLSMTPNNPFPIQIAFRRQFGSFLYASVAERAAHKMLHPYQHRNEWFKVDVELAKTAARTAHFMTKYLAIKHEQDAQYRACSVQA